ncbi:MAG: ORF6N domain-containing protein [Betaproteobacteria bacterium]|nr:ORF6N domain-containing protein [Betaproteobacteria bacterium]
MSEAAALPVACIAQAIVVVRGQKVLLDSDLAALYGVQTRRLNEQVRRNLERFPEDFMFQLNDIEYAALISQLATSKPGRGGRRKLPLAFTEHGAIMAATVLNSPRAVEVSVYVVRAFVRLREALASNQELAAKLDALEQNTERLSLQHETSSHNTRVQLKQVFEALRQLMAPPTEPSKRSIGFVTGDEKPKGKGRVRSKTGLSPRQFGARPQRHRRRQHRQRRGGD